MFAIDFLLNAEPWIEYTVRVNHLNEEKSTLASLRALTLQDDRIQAYLRDINDFHSTVVSTHKNPDLSVNKLIFLLELGLDRDVPEIDAAINAILCNKDNNGVYLSQVNIPKHFGGSGENTFGWCLCDAPHLAYALLKAGVEYDGQIKQGVDYLASLIRENGYPCAVSQQFGKFRGPGRKDDCCPYATLLMLKLFSQIPEYKESDQANVCIETLLNLWEASREQHPYMFYMGTDFRKLKAPVIWYDVLHVVDVLSQFSYAVNDKRFLEMIAIIKSKMDDEGCFTPESIYLKCKGFDFGQKKTPSAYLTYRCALVLKRCGLES